MRDKVVRMPQRSSRVSALGMGGLGDWEWGVVVAVVRFVRAEPRSKSFCSCTEN